MSGHFYMPITKALSVAECQNVISTIKQTLDANGMINYYDVIGLIGNPVKNASSFPKVGWFNNDDLSFDIYASDFGMYLACPPPVSLENPPDEEFNAIFKRAHPDEACPNMKEKPVDNVNHPQHYQSNTGLEVIEAIKAFVGDFASYCEGNILKYVCRYRHKNGLEDLKKARWYLNELINHIEKESNQND